eukprot:gene17796-21193_t
MSCITSPAPLSESYNAPVKAEPSTSVNPETKDAVAPSEGYLSDSIVQTTSSNRERKKGVAWTEEEHRLFLIGLQKLGKEEKVELRPAGAPRSLYLTVTKLHSIRTLLACMLRTTALGKLDLGLPVMASGPGPEFPSFPFSQHPFGSMHPWYGNYSARPPQEALHQSSNVCKPTARHGLSAAVFRRLFQGLNIPDIEERSHAASVERAQQAPKTPPPVLYAPIPTAAVATY